MSISTAEPLYDDFDFREYILENHDFDPTEERERYRVRHAHAVNSFGRHVTSSSLRHTYWVKEPITPNNPKPCINTF